MNQLGALTQNTIKRVETKMPFSAVGGTPSAMFIDHNVQVAVILVAPTTESSPVLPTIPVQAPPPGFPPGFGSSSAASSSSSHSGSTYHPSQPQRQNSGPPSTNSPVFVALVFDLRTGTFLTKQEVTKYDGDSWVVDDTGIFRERSGAVVQRLSVIADALPIRAAGVPDSSSASRRPGPPPFGGSSGSRMLPTMPGASRSANPGFTVGSPGAYRMRSGSLPLDSMGVSPPVAPTGFGGHAT